MVYAIASYIHGSFAVHKDNREAVLEPCDPAYSIVFHRKIPLIRVSPVPSQRFLPRKTFYKLRWDDGSWYGKPGISHRHLIYGRSILRC